MANYKTKINDRLAARNIAEEKCEEYLTEKNLHWSRFGFDETNKNIPFKHFIKVPELIRNAPDYICISNKAFFIETKGFNETLKIKENDLKSYSYWNNIMDLYFFAYDCEREIFHKITYKYILSVLPVSEIARYPDNKKLYYKINL
tara:strand:- start:1042 stop:1479 length:438 start_codon:yes stop_codon:yes gene_type:complete